MQIVAIKQQIVFFCLYLKWSVQKIYFEQGLALTDINITIAFKSEYMLSDRYLGMFCTIYFVRTTIWNGKI